MSIWANPAPKRTAIEAGNQRMAENPSRKSGKTNEPAVRSLPRNLNRPSEAMKMALAQGPDPADGLEKTVRRRVAVQDLDRPGRHQGHEGESEQADESDEGDDRPDHGMAERVAETFLEVGQDRSRAISGRTCGASVIRFSPTMTAMNDRPLMVKHQAGPKKA